MVKFIYFAVVLLAFSGLGMRASVAGEKVAVSLYLGENTRPDLDDDVAPEQLTRSLREVFGFKHYRLIKSGEIELRKNWEQWVVPRKDFFIRVEPLPGKAGEPKLIDYEIYKDGFIVAKGKYEPHEGIPLFINGPDFKSGRFIFVLEAK